MSKIGEMKRLITAEETVTYEGRTELGRLSRFTVTPEERRLINGGWVYQVKRRGERVGTMRYVGPDHGGRDMYDFEIKHAISGTHHFRAVETAPNLFELYSSDETAAAAA